MDFRILGPLEVLDEGRAVRIGGSKQRALLALLLVHANETLSTDRLVDELWGERPPASAATTVKVHVSRLRKALAGGNGSAGDGLVVTRERGYELRVDPERLDAHRFRRLVAGGRAELAAGDPQRAAAVLDEALELWRGEPLGELAFEPFAQGEVARLNELKVAALEQLIEAKLALGLHAEVIGQLDTLIFEHPYREGLRAQLMLALYRCDRQADALQAYQDARQTLVDELGIEPGERLRALERAILAQDPAVLEGQPKRATPGGAGAALPAPPNRTIGRDHEIGAIGERLRGRSVRLLTLTGPGGVGKTRLALEVARAVEDDFGAGAHFVSLVGLHRPEDVADAIVRALGIVMLSSESTQQAVERFLATKELLLVVDNFEHLLAAASAIGGLLEACPAVTVLATSREPLALQAEQRHPVSPLALPAPGSSTDVQADAVALFADRARARDPAFDLGDANAAAVAEICRRVDGLPLGIELAAARCGMLSAGEIAERLDAALGAGGAGARDAPPRQQTLRATIDWSYDLLDDDEKVCFARFAVFAGSAGVEAAETITAAGWETLDRLVSKSLLVRRGSADATSRLVMLDTIRAYAGDCFATADQDAVRQRHYRYYLALAERHGSDRALWGLDGNMHLAVLDADIENLHAALAWAVGRAEAEPALAMCAALGSYWLMRDRYADAVEWIDRALALPHADAHPTLRVEVLCSKVWCLWPIGRAAEQRAVAAEAEAIAREACEPGILSLALQTRAELEAVPGRLEVADALADEALRWADAAGDELAFACASCAKAIAAGTVAERRDRVDRAASLLDEVGCAYLLADLLGSAGHVALRAGSDRDAMELLDRAMPVARELDNGYIWMLLLGNYGLAALLTGDVDAARHAFRDELALCRDLVVPPMAAEGLRGLAAVAAVGGDVQRAARLVGAAATHRYGDPGHPVDARLDAAFFDGARARCGGDAWDAAAREGAGLSFEDAVADALEEQLA